MAAVAHEEEAENELEEAKAIHAASVFGKDSHLPTGDFARLVDEIGEDFHGDELQKQLSLVDPTETGKIDKEAFIKWYCNLENEENDDESSEKSDVAEERNNADKAFVRVAGVDSDSILASDFKKLIKSMGIVYCKEEHRASGTIKKISSVDASSGNKIITKKAFVNWYLDWLFGDRDSDSEADTSDVEPETDHKTSEVNAEDWGSVFKASDDECGLCIWTKAAKACAACGTVKPGEES